MMDIKIQLTKNPQPKPTGSPAFGKVFTDHMFVMDYAPDKGWHDAAIVPFGPIEVSPACTCLHYGQEIFEGMKAYRTAEGQVQLFRPEENFKRMNASADRLSIPLIDEAFMLDALMKLSLIHI